jgi:hypothetical protein
MPDKSDNPIGLDHVGSDSFYWSDPIGFDVRNQSDLRGSDDRMGTGNVGTNRNTVGKIRSDPTELESLGM